MVATLSSIICEDNDDNAHGQTPIDINESANKHEHAPCFDITCLSPPLA